MANHASIGKNEDRGFYAHQGYGRNSSRTVVGLLLPLACVLLGATSAYPSSRTEDFETGDFSKFPWQRTGNALWSIDTGYTGLYGGRSGSINHNQMTELSVLMTFAPGGGAVTFRYSVSCEANDDFQFAVDGSWSSPLLPRTGTWNQYSQGVPAGNHTIAFRYTKNGSVSSGDDAAWVDDVAFTGTVGDPVGTPAGLTATPSSFQVDLDWNDNLEPDLLGYNIYRGTTASGPYLKLNLTPHPSSDYRDTAVQNGTVYYYAVTSRDSEGWESDNSVEVSARPSEAGGQIAALSVPRQINYQAKVEVNGLPFEGMGQFKFAITNTAGDAYYWTNDGSTPTPPAEPTNAVGINVTRGLLSVNLGTPPAMTVLPASAFTDADTWLRIWFDDGLHGWQRLGGDAKLASVPYAMTAQTIADNSITGYKLQRESVWPEHEGRGNTVVAHYGAYSNGWAPLGTVPSGKTFIVTDVYFCQGQGGLSYIEVRVQKEATIDVIFKGQNTVYTSGVAQPCHIAFKAGIPVGPDWELQVRNYNDSNPHWCIISGYEYSN